MLNVIIGEGLHDKAFVAKWVQGFDALRERAAQFPLDKVARITEIAPEEIAAAVEALL